MHLRFVMMLLIFGHLTLLMTSVSAQSDPRRSARRLIFDQTHEFLFAVDHLAGMLHERGFNTVSSRDTFPPVDLQMFNVVLVHQSSVSIDVEDRSLQAIKEFVANGCGLYLMANRPHFMRYAREKKAYPIEKVLALFGLVLEAEPGHAPLTTVADPRFGAAFVLTRNDRLPIGAVAPRPGQPVPSSWKMLATDADGRCVLGILEYGKGRVVVATEHSLIGRPNEPAQIALLVKLFDWLARTSEVTPVPARPAPVLEYREPQMVLERNGVQVRYPAPLKEGAEYLLNAYDRFYHLMYDFFQSGPTGHLRLEALATGGGAFTDRPLIAMGVLADRAGIDGFILWEMTNAWYLPEAPSFTEAWATFIHEELGPKTGAMTAEQAAKNRAAQLEIVRADDPNLDKFDISIPNPDVVMKGKPQKDRDWGHFRMLKCGVVLRELYQQYGKETFRRLIRIHRAQYGDDTSTPDFDSYVREFSLAAGEDLTPFFRCYGATVGTLKLPTTREGILKEARRILDEAASRGRTGKKPWKAPRGKLRAEATIIG